LNVMISLSMSRWNLQNLAYDLFSYITAIAFVTYEYTFNVETDMQEN